MPTIDAGPVLFAVGVFAYLALAIAVGYFARSKGYSMALGIALAIVTSFLAAWIILAMLPEKTSPPTKAAHEDKMFRLQVELEKARLKAQENRAATQGGQ
jgi:ABC-type transport system involved in multi-copper enzyme maturation permease subunit